MIAKKIRPSITELAPLIKQSLSDGKNIRLTVTGNSMYPLLRSDIDTVIIEKASDFKKYDVVLYQRQNGQYIFHRIVKVCGDKLAIAGDNETVKEYPIDKAACIGRMKAFERFGRQWGTDAPWYVLYSRVWVCCFPFRRPMGKILKAAAKVYHKIKG